MGLVDIHVTCICFCRKKEPQIRPHFHNIMVTLSYEAPDLDVESGYYEVYDDEFEAIPDMRESEESTYNDVTNTQDSGHVYDQTVHVMNWPAMHSRRNT